MRRRRASEQDHESSHGIDLAPMLDFVINLLIFFIITAVFVKESGLIVNRPTNQSAETPEDTGTIYIQILDTGEVFVDNRPTDAKAVRANVERLSAVKPEAGALIVAQEGAPTGILVDVVDQVHLGGIYNITFSTSR